MKKVIISFDDAFETDYLTTFGIFKKYGIKGTSFISTNDIGKKGHLDWWQIREMAKGGWDFQCHTHNHADLNSLSNEEIDSEFRLVNNEFMRHLMPIPKYHAYPYGNVDARVEKIIKKYRKGARGTSSANGSDYHLQSYALHRIGNQLTIQENKGMDLTDRNALFLHTHDVSDKPSEYGVTKDRLEDAIKLLKEKGFKFITLTEYFEGDKPEMSKEKIPNIIHQIWMGDDPIPQEWTDSWKKKNPNFKHILWTEEKIRKMGLVNMSLFDDYKNLKKKDGRIMYHAMADVARTEILYKYGGVFLDADMECIESIEGAGFLDWDFFSVYEQDRINPTTNKNLIACGVIGATKEHPILKEYVKRVGKSIAQIDDAWKNTGPLVLTNIVEELGYQNKILPAFTFLPYHHTGTVNTPVKGYTQYAEHHWYSSPTYSRYVIMSAGTGSRWKKYLGVPKQMVPIDREPILHRTIRLLRKNGVKNIIVTVPKKGYFGRLDAVEIEGSSKYEMDRFLNAKNGQNATFLYGDVYYTEELIQNIVTDAKRNDQLRADSPKFWGRTDLKQGIGRGIPEIFAVRFSRELWKIAKKLREVCSIAGSGWNVYFYFTQKEVPVEPKERIKIIRETTTNNPFFEPVLDITEDFDSAADYDTWIRNYNKLRPVTLQTKEIKNRYSQNQLVRNPSGMGGQTKITKVKNEYKRRKWYNH